MGNLQGLRSPNFGVRMTGHPGGRSCRNQLPLPVGLDGAVGRYRHHAGSRWRLRQLTWWNCAVRRLLENQVARTLKRDPKHIKNTRSRRVRCLHSIARLLRLVLLPVVLWCLDEKCGIVQIFPFTMDSVWWLFPCDVSWHLTTFDDM